MTSPKDELLDFLRHSEATPAAKAMPFAEVSALGEIGPEQRFHDGILNAFLLGKPDEPMGIERLAVEFERRAGGDVLLRVSGRLERATAALRERGIENPLRRGGERGADAEVHRRHVGCREHRFGRRAPEQCRFVAPTQMRSCLDQSRLQ